MDFRKELLETVIAEYKLSDIEYMRNITMTLENWKEEIVNSFHTYDGRKLSNGPIEGRNRIVKIILRLANGYTNFNRFRNRVLYVLNKYETYREKILDVHKIRKTGTPKKKNKIESIKRQKNDLISRSFHQHNVITLKFFSKPQRVNFKTF